MGSTTAMTSLKQLRRDLAGAVILPDDAAYHRARTVYNVMHESWPVAVVRPAHAVDVARVVRFARDEGLMLAVRGGNHSMRGYGSCDDGIVLDLSRMRSVEVDPDARVAHVGGGATWGDVNDATHRHGLATTGGLISTTGVGGLTLGGGIGYLTRRLGLACDNLIAAELVNANGEVLQVDAAHEADLFHAIRGGGGNFGVVTRFTFRVAPVGTVLGGPTVFPLEHDVIRGFDAWLRAAPRELGAILGLSVAPPLPFLPEERHGSPAAIIITCWSGSKEEGRDVVRGLEDIGRPWGGSVAPLPYPRLNTLFDDLLPVGLRHYWRSQFVAGLHDDAVHVYVAHGRRTPNVESGIFLYPVDGTAHDVSAADTAWAHRDARYLIGFHGSWHDAQDDDRMINWVRDAHSASSPWAGAGAYVNFASGDDDDPDAHGDVADRLVETKRRHDPHNLFCLNANIDPDRPA